MPVNHRSRHAPVRLPTHSCTLSYLYFLFSKDGKERARLAQHPPTLVLNLSTPRREHVKDFQAFAPLSEAPGAVPFVAEHPHHAVDACVGGAAKLLTVR